MERTIAVAKKVPSMRNVLLIASFIVFGLLCIPRMSWAIPAWARKYGAKCNMCHRPNVPRLNVTGHNFRKLGYRMEDEIGKSPEYKEVGNYIAIRGRLRYEYENPDEEDSSNGFKWNDATLFYSGPITENLSAFFEVAWEDTDETNVVAHVSWLLGTADRFLKIRAGQFHTLPRVGWAGFDRPSGISTTGVLDNKLTTTPVPFKLSQDQQGLELSLGITRDIRILGQVLNGINFEGEGTWSSDDDKDKDFLLAYEHILDMRGSGFTLYGYRGIWHQEPGTEVASGIFLSEKDDIGDNENKFEFYRYGLTASLVLDLFEIGHSEVLGGTILSRDNFPSDYPIKSKDITGQAYFAELEQYFEDASVFARADFIRKDNDEHNWDNKYVAGGAYMVNEYLRLGGEGFLSREEVRNIDTVGFTIEAMLNF